MADINEKTAPNTLAPTSEGQSSTNNVIIAQSTGTNIDKLMPPIARFGNTDRSAKKQTVIDKLAKFFDKFFGIS